MKKILLCTFILFGCVSHENEYVLTCELSGTHHSWYSKDKIYFDPKAQAYYVNGNYVSPGGALCMVYYND